MFLSGPQTGQRQLSLQDSSKQPSKPRLPNTARNSDGFPVLGPSFKSCNEGHKRSSHRNVHQSVENGNNELDGKQRLMLNTRLVA